MRLRLCLLCLRLGRSRRHQLVLHRGMHHLHVRVLEHHHLLGVGIHACSHLAGVHEHHRWPSTAAKLRRLTTSITHLMSPGPHVPVGTRNWSPRIVLGIGEKPRRSLAFARRHEGPNDAEPDVLIIVLWQLHRTMMCNALAHESRVNEPQFATPTACPRLASNRNLTRVQLHDVPCGMLTKRM